MKNPLSDYEKSWYPPIDWGLAYHATMGETARDAQKAFHAVFKAGEIVCAAQRGSDRHKSYILDTDRVAGDSSYVFLSVGIPVGAKTFYSLAVQERGFAFAFDAIGLISKLNATVGISDLHQTYSGIENQMLPHSVGSDPDYFMELVEPIQEVMRLRDDDALRWSHSIFSGENPPTDLVADAKDVIYHYHAGDSHTYQVVPANWQEAVNDAELLVHHKLPLNQCNGVIYAGIWFEIDDFLSLAKKSFGQRLPKIVLAERWGFPYRCPNCNAPLTSADTLAEVVKLNPWIKMKTNRGYMEDFIKCNACLYYHDRNEEPYYIDHFLSIGDETREAQDWIKSLGTRVPVYQTTIAFRDDPRQEVILGQNWMTDQQDALDSMVSFKNDPEIYRILVTGHIDSKDIDMERTVENYLRSPERREIFVKDPNSQVYISTKREI